jgi:hypothetical protein
LKKLREIKSITYLQLVLAHIGLGILLFAFRPLSKFVLFAIILYFIYRIFQNGNRKDEVLLAAGYITGFEVFSRMTGGAFSYEFAKYAVIGFLSLGMFFRGFNSKSWPYIFYLLCLLPGILLAAINLSYSAKVGNAIGFNLSGPVCLGIAALYCYNRKMPRERFHGILLAVLLPIIATTTYLYLYAPSIREVLDGTASNFAASGGYGPNQVATVLGLGMFILFSRLFLIKSRAVNTIDLLLLAAVSYRAIVTFSRGGVITAFACMLVFIAIYFLRASAREKAISLPKLVLLTVVGLGIWGISSLSTQGLIDKRYANQDALGREKADITTGRSELIESELQAFFDHPVTGIGVGKNKEYRMETIGELSATHNEVSRMLAEHGLLGVLALGILIFTPLIYRIKNRTNVYLYAFLVFWFLTINHSSMRIAAPAFIYGLSLITLFKPVGNKATLHR